MESELSAQAEKRILLKGVQRQAKLRQLFIPVLLVVLVVLVVIGWKTEARFLIALCAGFIFFSFSLFLIVARFAHRTESLTLDQIQHILSGVFVLEVLTIWLFFYLFGPIAAAYQAPLPYLATIFYIFYIILVAPFFRGDNIYQNFFYGLIWIALAILFFLNSSCRFLFDYGSSPCPGESSTEGLLLLFSGLVIFMVQFVVNHFQEQANWTSDQLRRINQALKEKLKEEGYQFARLRQEQNSMRTRNIQKLREKDRQIRDLNQRLKERLESGQEPEEDQEASQMKETTEALLNILEDTEEARQRAEAEREKTMTIINNFVDALLVVDYRGLIQMINTRAREVFGLQGSDQGRPLLELGNNSKLSPALDHILDGHQLKVVKRAGFEPKEGIFYEVSTVPMPSSEEGQDYLVVFHDVSREKLVQRMKTEFVSIAAHQLRTPLSAIKWSLKMLLDGDEGELNNGQKTLMKKTYWSNQRMINLVNDLLNVSRIEEGRFLYELEETDLREMVKRSITTVETTASRKKIKISFKPGPKKLPLIKADQEKLSLAIQNLIDNAVKYSKEGGQVIVSIAEENGHVLVSVEDQGIGIPRAQQPRVFQRFFRAGNAINQETEGTGLGLFITRNIIEAHQGQIWFKSKENQGTTFYFKIPY